VGAAFVAAYLLVLQSLFGAFAHGIQANAAPLDAFGNVICTHEGLAELPAGDPGQKQLPPCCVLGCMMGTQVLGSPPDAERLQASVAFEVVAFRFPMSDHLTFARERSPANPRAPPELA
jgi:hypothetical protein